MASLTDTQISSTYTGLLKTADNGDLSGNTGSSTVNISDGIGTATKLNLSTTRIGIGTTSPDSLLHVVDGSGAPVRLGYDASNYAIFTVDSSGNLGFAASGGTITCGDTLRLAGTGVGSGGKITNGGDQDILTFNAVNQDVRLYGKLRVDGNEILSSGGLTALTLSSANATVGYNLTVNNQLAVTNNATIGGTLLSTGLLTTAAGIKMTGVHQTIDNSDGEECIALDASQQVRFHNIAVGNADAGVTDTMSFGYSGEHGLFSWGNLSKPNMLTMGGNFCYLEIHAQASKNAELHLRPNNSSAEQWNIMASYPVPQCLAFRQDGDVKLRLYNTGGLRVEAHDSTGGFLDIAEGTVPSAPGSSHSRIWTNDDVLNYIGGDGVSREIMAVGSAHNIPAGVTIDNAHAAGGLLLNTLTSSGVTKIGNATSETTIGDNLTIDGDAIVKGDIKLFNEDATGRIYFSNNLEGGSCYITFIDEAGYTHDHSIQFVLESKKIFEVTEEGAHVMNGEFEVTDVTETDKVSIQVYSAPDLDRHGLRLVGDSTAKADDTLEIGKDFTPNVLIAADTLVTIGNQNSVLIGNDSTSSSKLGFFGETPVEQCPVFSWSTDAAHSEYNIRSAADSADLTEVTAVLNTLIKELATYGLIDGVGS